MSPESPPPRPATFKTHADGRGGLVRVTLVGGPHAGYELYIDELDLPGEIWTSPAGGRLGGGGAGGGGSGSPSSEGRTRATSCTSTSSTFRGRSGLRRRGCASSGGVLACRPTWRERRSAPTPRRRPRT